MNVSLYQAAAALDGNTRWQQLIAENLAASSTPAYKKLEVAFGNIQAGVLGAGSESVLEQNIPTLLPTPFASINFTQGSLQGTNVKSNLALDGPGFFAVQLEDGSTAYTRDGEFRVDLQGQMIDKNNYPLLSDGGQVLQVDPRRKEDIAISNEGRVTQAGEFRGLLGVVEFPDPSQLRPVGGGYFVADTLQPEAANQTQVMQGFLEQANTVSMIEMSTLMLALRHYEANQRVIQMHDERMGKMIQELSHTT